MEQNSAFQMTQQIPRKSQTSSAATETPEKKYFDIRRVSSKKKKVIWVYKQCDIFPPNIFFQ